MFEGRFLWLKQRVLKNGTDSSHHNYWILASQIRGSLLKLHEYGARVALPLQAMTMDSNTNF